MSNKNLTPNKLINEKSPYLLQHAYNPVNWQSWSEEAFEKAKTENKPIFLSIGYATCHWCHVMEHESFEDIEVAKLLNEDYISIKVDREERPDIDHIYMTACQIMTRSGGWPLTIIMKPDKKPFFAGTYFPKESRHGRIGMLDLLPQISNIWKNKYDEIDKSSEDLYNILNQVTRPKESDKELNSNLLKNAFNQLNFSFDNEKGGFGNAPKFPTPHNYLFLLRYFIRTKEKRALEIVEKSLQEMKKGGIYDHIGFGFHRYSTDKNWFLPHFEKMLYDQALLIMAYSEAYVLTKRTIYLETVKETIEYILRDMMHNDGGFYSAEDADSEGEEGKFYLWSENELKEILGDDTSLFTQTFNTTKEGNYTEEATRHRTGTNILFLQEFISPENTEKIKAYKKKLFSIRKKRIHPLKDDKILTDWNGLMIAALSIAYRSLGEREKTYSIAIENAINFIIKNLYKEGRLLHRYRDNESIISGHLDDYAFFIWGLLESYQSFFKKNHLDLAITLCEKVIEEFYDDKNSGFFFSSIDAKDLIVRTKESYDGAIPSGNSVMIQNLLKLSKITGEKTYETLANKCLQAFSPQIEQSPMSHCHMLSGLDLMLNSSIEISINGDISSIETIKMLDLINKYYLPNAILSLKTTDKTAQVHICQNSTCMEPIESLQELKDTLEKLYDK